MTNLINYDTLAKQHGYTRLNDEGVIRMLGLNVSGTIAFTKGSLRILFSPLEQHPDGLWAHASISHPNRYPDWNEILDVRYTFFDSENDVFQVLPPKSEYINVHKNCFHLWSPLGRRITPK